jgi:hypothetical protein
MTSTYQLPIDLSALVLSYEESSSESSTPIVFDEAPGSGTFDNVCNNNHDDDDEQQPK